LLLTSAGASHDVVDHWTVRFADAYRNELQDFVDSVLAGKPARVTAQDGLHALAISIAAERSYHESRPIALDGKKGARLFSGLSGVL
jgi:predicted dehydrogenase